MHHIKLEQMADNNKVIWQFPWKYNESFAISVALIIIGMALEIINMGRGVPPPVYPINIIILAVLITSIAALYIMYKNAPFIKWLSSVPAAISSIVSVVMLSLFMGIIPQSNINTGFWSLVGLTHVFQSWAFVLSCLYLTVVLGFTIAKRISKFNLKNIGFLFNHVGLFIVIVSAMLGSGDITKMYFRCNINTPTNAAMSTQNKMFAMPFTLELSKFQIDEYPPYIIMFENNTGEIFNEKNKTKCEAIEGKDYKIKNYYIHIDRFTENSIMLNDSVISSDNTGAFNSALVTVTNNDATQLAKGFISNGSYIYQPLLLAIDNDNSITLSKPEVKRYISYLKLTGKDGKSTDIQIEVNKSYSINGWDLYQYSYDTEKGKWSEYSIIQAVNDPWLIYVYIGIYMLIIGAVFLFWQGKKF